MHRIGRVGRAGREGVAITLAEPREHRMLKTIEKVAGASIAVQKVPTVADLRARRLELTRAALRESLLTDELDRFRVVVETLSDEFDLMEVALAAVKLAHEAGGGTDDDEEIPQVSFRPDQGTSRGATKSGRRREGDDRPPARGARPGGPAARLFVGMGRDAGVRPGDLVGRHHRRDRADRPRHRRHRDPPAVRAGGGARVRRRRGRAGPAGDDDQGPEGDDPPRSFLRVRTPDRSGRSAARGSAPPPPVAAGPGGAAGRRPARRRRPGGRAPADPAARRASRRAAGRPAR